MQQPSNISPAPGRPPAVIHVDLDGARQIYDYHGWDWSWNDDPLFDSGLTGLLDFLSENRIRATLFTIAADLEDDRKLELLREAVRRGHEIASHSVTHPRMNELDAPRKREEIAESKARLERALGVEVRGFRAPGYTIDRECVELLAESGYTWDSSTFPDREFARRLEVAGLPQAPHRPLGDRGVVELPLPRYRPAPFPFHPCYSLLLGQTYFKLGVRRFRRAKLPLVFLFHLTDFAEPLAADRLTGWRSRIMTLSSLPAARKRRRCQAMIDEVRSRFEVVDTQTLLEVETDR